MTKRIYKKLIIVGAAAFSLFFHNLFAQKEEDQGKQLINLRYFNVNNSMQYLIVQSQRRKGKDVSPQQNKTYSIFMDVSEPDKLVAKVTTDQTGRAKTFIPPSLKSAWDSTPQHIFIVKEGDEELIADYSVTRSKISIDTATVDSVRTIVVNVAKWDKDSWIPAPDVEMKIGVKRLGGILSAGDEVSYTTDSTGGVSVEFKKQNLPGDLKGNFVIAAKVEDNDIFGNLEVSKTVPWGAVLQYDKTFFNKRTLWSTSFRAPYWLMFMAYGIIFSVWTTLIYLIFQMVKIKKLGTEEG